MAAFMMLVALALVALVVDLGRIAYLRARLQHQTDAAALSGAYDVGPCAESAEDPGDDAQAAATGNGFAGALGSVVVGDVTVSDGQRVFTQTDDVDSAEAVQVHAEHTIPRSIVLPSQLTGTVDLQADAAARTRAIGALWLGTTLVSIDSTKATLLNSTLGAALGSSINLSAVSYQGLLDAQVTLGELLSAQGSVQSIDDFLALQFTGAQFLQLLVTALNAQGSAAATTVNTLRAAATTGSPVTVGEWLQVSPGSETQAEDAAVSAFDLAQGSVLAGRQGQIMNVSSLSLGVLLPSGVTAVSLRAVVVEPPQIAVGPPGQTQSGAWRTEVRSAQVRAELGIESSTSVAGLATVKITLPVFVDLAQGLARLQSIHCPRADDPVARVAVSAQAGLVAIGIGQFSNIGSSSTVSTATIATVSSLFNVQVARVDATTRSTSSSSATKLLEFTGPFVPRIAQPASAHTASIGNSSTAIIDAAESSLSYPTNTGLTVVLVNTFPLGLSNTLILNAVRAAVNLLLPNLSTLIPAVLEGLGARVGGADLTVLAVEMERPALIR